MRIDFTRSQINSMIRMFVKERLSTVAIGEIYGVTCNTIIDRLKENGVEVNLSKIRTKYFTPKQRTDIVRRYSGGRGESTVTLGALYGCSYATIRRVLKEENVFNPSAVPYNKIVFTDKQLADILAFYEKGGSAKSISKMFSCSDSVILTVLRDHGIDTNDFGRGKKPKPVPFKGFVSTCRSLTKRIYKTHKDKINKDGKLYPQYHVDHKLSIREGIDHELTVFDLAHPCNLHMLTAEDNLSKYTRSILTKRELLDRIKKWNKKYGDPFAQILMDMDYAYRYGRYRYYSGEYTHFKVNK